VSTALNFASYVIWFNERLNFGDPTIGGIEYNQGLLYSAIRNTAGDGDKFASPGSGFLQLDTDETINGITRLGNILITNLTRSNVSLEITTDAFNPYFNRSIP